MVKRAKVKLIWAAGVLLSALSLVPAEAAAKGGRPADPADAVRSRERDRAESRDVTHGRAIIFRAGHLPPLAPEEPSADKKHPAEPAHPTHYLDTTLPILIQGAPNELALRRYAGTS
jgi:hypothetical protein